MIDELVTVDDLLQWLHPDWHADAACKETPDINFFPRRGEDAQPARDVCGRCSVAAECAEAGAAEKGIWGGLSERQRRAARRSVRVDAAVQPSAA